MSCPHCAIATTTALSKRTALGDRTFRWSGGRRTCNARTGTPCNYLQSPSHSVLLVILWCLRSTLSLRDR